MPVTVVPRSSATVAIETFMTELSSVIRNWPAANVNRTSWPPERVACAFVPSAMVCASSPDLVAPYHVKA